MKLAIPARTSRSAGDAQPRRRWIEAGALAALVAAAIVYHYLQGQGRVTPWIFPDEFRYAEAARAAAETGVPRVRGDLDFNGLLHAYALAPAWLMESASGAWAAAKALGATAFSAAAIPVYFLCRQFASLIPSLLAAAAAVLVPAAFYGSTLMQEPFAYPLAATAALLTVRTLERFTVWRAAGLVVTLVIATGVRAELAVLPVAAGVAMVADSVVGRMRGNARRMGGGAILAAAVVAGLSTLLAVRGVEPLRHAASVAARDPGSLVNVATDTFASVALGLGLVPVVALLMTLPLIGGPDRARSAFSSTAAAFGVVLLSYTALKAASSDYLPFLMVEERNVIYLEPLALVSLVVVAGRARMRSMVACVVVVAVLVLRFPMDTVARSQVLSENPGLSWVWQLAHNAGGVDESAVLLMGGIGLVGTVMLSGRRSPAVLVAAVGAWLAISGSLTYRGDHRFSTEIAAALPADRSWIDTRVRGGEVALILTEDDANLNPAFSLAFWNRSIGSFVGLHASPAGLSGFAVTRSSTGELDLDRVQYALHRRSAAINGRAFDPGQSSPYVLTQIIRPARVAARVEGRTLDGWAGSRLRVIRYLDGPVGIAAVDVSTVAAFSPRERTVEVDIAGRRWRWVIPAGVNRRLAVPVPSGPLVLEFHLAPAETPASFGGSADLRTLSLRIGAVRVPGAPTLAPRGAGARSARSPDSNEPTEARPHH